MHYILKLDCLEVMLIIAIIILFWPFVFPYFGKVFCKGLAKNCSNYKILYKCSYNYYHFSSSITFIFMNRVFFCCFFSL